jgi:hypothetical protein
MNAGKQPPGYRTPLRIDQTQIFQAFSLLMGMNERDVITEKCHQYASYYSGARFEDIKDPPTSIRSILEEWDMAEAGLPFEDPWASLRETAVEQAVLILAFANVSGADGYGDLPLYYLEWGLIGDSEFMNRVKEWDGKKDLLVEQRSWFRTIASFMHCESDIFEMDNTALVSSSGWSLYVSTLGSLDPSHIGTLVSTFTIRVAIC